MEIAWLMDLRGVQVLQKMDTDKASYFSGREDIEAQPKRMRDKRGS